MASGPKSIMKHEALEELGETTWFDHSQSSPFSLEKGDSKFYEGRKPLGATDIGVSAKLKLVQILCNCKMTF